MEKLQFEYSHPDVEMRKRQKRIFLRLALYGYGEEILEESDGLKLQSDSIALKLKLLFD